MRQALRARPQTWHQPPCGLLRRRAGARARAPVQLTRPPRAPAGTTPGWTRAGRARQLQRPALRCSSTPASARFLRCAPLRARATTRPGGASDAQLGGRRLAATRSAGGTRRTTGRRQRRRRHACADALHARRSARARALTIAALAQRVPRATPVMDKGGKGLRHFSMKVRRAERAAKPPRHAAVHSGADVAAAPRHAPRFARRWSRKGAPRTTRLPTSS